MSLTPEEIAEKEFLIGLRGYDKDEVRAFLRTVADAFSEASQEPAETPQPAAEPEPVAPAPVASAPEPAAPASGTDWASLGEEIAAVLRTAHEQASTLRSEAETEAAALRQQAADEALVTRGQADAHAEEARAAAEQERNEAAAKLTAAQDEALNLVADAQVRVDSIMEQTKVKAQQEADAEVAGLRDEIQQLIATRDAARASLGELRTKVDNALAVAEIAEPVAEPSSF